MSKILNITHSDCAVKIMQDAKIPGDFLPWQAFRSTSPKKWHDLLNTDTSALPFLNGVIIRLLEDYPNSSNGLSRTAQ